MSDQPDFGSFGRFIETPVDEMPSEMKEAYEFTKGLRGLVPGPHRIWLTNPRLSKTIVPTGAYYQKHSRKLRLRLSQISLQPAGCRPMRAMNTRR